MVGLIYSRYEEDVGTRRFNQQPACLAAVLVLGTGWMLVVVIDGLGSSRELVLVRGDCVVRREDCGMKYILT